jgi:hypothetical protein
LDLYSVQNYDLNLTYHHVLLFNHMIKYTCH